MGFTPMREPFFLLHLRHEFKVHIQLGQMLGLHLVYPPFNLHTGTALLLRNLKSLCFDINITADFKDFPGPLEYQSAMLIFSEITGASLTSYGDLPSSWRMLKENRKK